MGQESLSPPAMVHLPQDEFLTALTRLFGATRDKGSLYITFKRVPVKGATVAEGEQPPSECLIRARSEKKRISTTVRVRATRVLSATPVRVELARAGRGRGGGGGGSVRWRSAPPSSATAVDERYQYSQPVCARLSRAQASPKDFVRLHSSMQNILTVHMDSLKKKERTKKGKVAA